MGLDINVYRILKKKPEINKEDFGPNYFRLIDDDGNYCNNFPEWTKQCEYTITEKWYDWEKYKEETGIDINQMNWHGEEYSEEGYFMTVGPKDKEWPEWDSKNESYDDYKKRLNEVAVKIDLEKVPSKDKEIKVLYREEVGYQRKGLNSKFYQDYRDGKIGYFVWDLKELKRYKKDYCDKAYRYKYPNGELSDSMVYEKRNFQNNIINKFIEGECCVTFSW